MGDSGEGLRRYRAEEVAEMLGLNPKTVKSMYLKGYLKGRTPRGLTRPVLFKMEDIVDWVDGGEGAAGGAGD